MSSAFRRSARSPHPGTAPRHAALDDQATAYGCPGAVRCLQWLPRGAAFVLPRQSPRFLRRPDLDDRAPPTLSRTDVDPAHAIDVGAVHRTLTHGQEAISLDPSVDDIVCHMNATCSELAGKALRKVSQGAFGCRERREIRLAMHSPAGTCEYHGSRAAFQNNGRCRPGQLKCAKSMFAPMRHERFFGQLEKRSRLIGARIVGCHCERTKVVACETMPDTSPRLEFSPTTISDVSVPLFPVRSATGRPFAGHWEAAAEDRASHIPRQRHSAARPTSLGHHIQRVMQEPPSPCC